MISRDADCARFEGKVRVHVSIRERSSRENVTCLGQGTRSIGSKMANPEEYSQCEKVEMNDMPSSNLTCRACPIRMKINAICAGHQLVLLEARVCSAAMKRNLKRNETVCNDYSWVRQRGTSPVAGTDLTSNSLSFGFDFDF